MQGLVKLIQPRSTEKLLTLTKPFRQHYCPWGRLVNRAAALLS